MAKLLEIECLNNGLVKYYPLGTSLLEIAKDQQIVLPNQILGARVNNVVEELNYEIFKPKKIKFIDYTDSDGKRMYERSLMFILLKAVKELYPQAHLRIEHSISKGYYCELDDLGCPVTDELVTQIQKRMLQIVAADYPFVRQDISAEDALSLFEQNGFTEKVQLFKTCPEYFTQVHFLNGQVDYFYGYLVPSTSYIKVFGLDRYLDGMLLRLPNKNHPSELDDYKEQRKLFDIFREFKSWAKILGIANVGSMNQAIKNKTDNEFIKIGEALHEKKVASIADSIKSRKGVKLVLIAGPSSSGKTTFCMRLAIQLKVAELKPIFISLDNYFVDRDATPRDEHGEYDFESVDTLDIPKFQQDLLDLLDGKEIDVPKFSFQTGTRYYDGTKMKMQADNVLLLEGIHALNPKLTSVIAPEQKFRIYISALTTMGIDSHNRISTTDNRLLRRIIRDHRYRGYSAQETIKRWPSVKRGEEKWIFPFQEEADVMFNSALIYELSLLKRFAEPLLKEVQPVDPCYSEANRLLKLLSYFKIMDRVEEVPPTSLIREFLYGSTFKYT